MSRLRKALYGGMVMLCWAVLSGSAFAQRISEMMKRGAFESMLEGSSDSQQIATVNTFLGRSDLNSSLTGLARSSSRCDVHGTKSIEASAWVTEHARRVKLLMFNENHYEPGARAFVRALLPKLRQVGFTHIGFETFPPRSAMGEQPYVPESGYYSVEPVFAALIRDSRQLGFELFGYEHMEIPKPDIPIEAVISAREEGQARNLKSVMDAAPDSARFIIFAGWSHIAEAALPMPGGPLEWMAARFRKSTAIDPLTIDMTSCAYAAEAFDSRGRMYIDDAGAVRVSGMYAGAVDAQVHLAVPRSAEEGVGFYRRVLGSPTAIPESLRSQSMPLLVQAFGANVDDPVAYDRVLVNVGEQPFLYLQSGRYNLIANRGDGQVLEQVTIDVR